MSFSRSALVVALALGVGCGGRQASDAGTDSSTEDSTQSSSTVGESESGDPSETETSESGETETGGEGICGDGIVDPGELCDDPSADPPTCAPDCLHPLVACGNTVADCGDTLDNDDDGFIDLDDPDCIGPCDYSEAAFALELPAVAGLREIFDCWWDSDAGAGNDQCYHDVRCDPEAPGLPWFPHDPNLPSCNQGSGPNCVELCAPLAPNGCDCFGCCLVDGAPLFLGFQRDLGELPPELVCSHETLDNCNSCTLDLDCFNPCDEQGCELCFLQAPNELAPGCSEPACPPGVDSCVSPYACPEGEVCRTGCCVSVFAF